VNSVDDLIIRDVEQTLRLDIEERCKRWQKVVLIIGYTFFERSFDSEL
jgi:hypothetical protein